MDRLRLTFPYFVLGGVVVVVVVSNLPVGASKEVQHSSRVTMCPPCGMEIDPNSALTADVNGRTHYFCCAGCRERFQREAATEQSARGTERVVDVVCNMEVNPAWGISAQYAGRTYYFCVDRCRERFEEDPTRYLSAKCTVCETPLEGLATFPATYMGNTYELCSVEHRSQFKQDPASFFLHTMWGLPPWLYYASIAIVLLVSFGLFDWLGRRGDPTAKGHERESAVAGLLKGRPAAPGEEAPVAPVLPPPPMDRDLRPSPRRRMGHPRRIDGEGIRGEGERLLEGIPGSVVSGTTSAIRVATPALRHATAPLRDATVMGRTLVPDAQTPTAAGVRSTSPASRRDRFDLLSIAWVKRAACSRVFRFSLQAFVTVSFLLIIGAGLFGNQNPSLNIAPILTWTVWWGLLVVLVLYAGKAWCYVCPWDAMAGWAERLALWRKSDEGLSVGWSWPRIVRNISIATILFVGLTWIELGFGVTMKPRITAYLAIGMLLMAVVSALLFDRKSFCRYGCLVGRVSGLYALFAGTEVRPRDRDRCRACGTKECVKGSETAYGCPTFLYPGKLQVNTYCIQCMECIQACPHDNLAVNLRPWGSDLAVEGKPRTDEAYLALLMLAITGFHGLTMTPAWGQFVDALREFADLGRVVGFSVGMLLLMTGPVAIYAVLVALSKHLAGRDAPTGLSYHDYFVRYAYALLPIALFYHIAHNSEHLLMEGPKIAALISDPFGWGWNLFGTAGWVIPPLISLDKLWLLQVALVLIGHVYSLWVAQRTSLRLFGSGPVALRSQVPMLIGMICFSVFSLWLLKQPMEMRTSAM